MLIWITKIFKFSLKNPNFALKTWILNLTKINNVDPKNLNYALTTNIWIKLLAFKLKILIWKTKKLNFNIKKP